MSVNAPYVCELCLKSFKVKKTYDRHVESQTCITAINERLCPYCHEVFQSPYFLNRHLNKRKSCVDEKQKQIIDTDKLELLNTNYVNETKTKYYEKYQSELAKQQDKYEKLEEEYNKLKLHADTLFKQRIEQEAQKPKNADLEFVFKFEFQKILANYSTLRFRSWLLLHHDTCRHIIKSIKNKMTNPDVSNIERQMYVDLIKYRDDLIEKLKNCCIEQIENEVLDFLIKFL
jgi:hypothetical protein